MEVELYVYDLSQGLARQMLKPQLDSAMRGITQAPVAPSAIPQQNGASQVNGNSSYSIRASPSAASNSGYMNGSSGLPTGQVHYATTLKKLDVLLESAKNSCAVIFFTSATCPPCKLVYPAYDELAAEAGDKAVLIKVDLSEAYEIGSKYQVRATPTFMSFLKGEKESEWVGASESQLRGNVRMLLQMAHPPHPHSNLRLRTLQRRHKTVTYTKIPPLEKLIAKMGTRGTDPAITALKDFICTREASGASDAPLPSLPSIAFFIQSIQQEPPESTFPVIDLLRCASVDPRISGYFAAEHSHTTIINILSKLHALGEKCPYSLRIVTLQLACNLFTSPILAHQLLRNAELSTPLVQLITTLLLDTAHPPVRVAAASLAFNMAAVNHARRLDGQEEDLLGEASQVELMVSLLETLPNESESKDSVRGLLTAIGLLAYGAPRDGELVEVCRALGAKETVSGKRAFSEDLEELVKEVEQVVA
ncbi:MAG: hypothetical protein Q9208_004322 [Pyrenodesmia sp. 3 TL-2023]